jgi:mRNA-degrading endonuclease RelE of RelBE toxin-antitoxin system
MDKVAKLLKKLIEKERSEVLETLSALLSGETKQLDIKKLKGVDSVYRARVGNLRIIFRKGSAKDVRILDIARRDEQTYRGL